MYMARNNMLPLREPGVNPGQFADYCHELRNIPTQRTCVENHWEIRVREVSPEKVNEPV